jgi:predicted Zn-dependent peptidase
MKSRKREKVSLHRVNGYRIILQPTANPTIKVECAVNAGFVTETKETSGVNHLLEHILTDAWVKCGTTCSGYWMDKGVDMNASTDETLLRYHTRGTLTYIDQMVEYITNISTHPIFKMQVLKKEKEAVIDELLTYGNDPESDLDQLFNENFYTGGLVHKDDWRLQIKNLKRMDLEMVKRTFVQNYNPRNIMFIVTGKFKKAHLLEIFERELKKKDAGKRLVVESCFSRKHRIVHAHLDSPTSKIVLGFPSCLSAHEESSFYLNTLCNVLNNILFEKLRTELGLVYGVHFNYDVNVCGTTLLCSVYVREKNIVPCLHNLFKTLQFFKTNPFPQQQILSSRERELFNYNNSLPYTKDYLLQYMHQIKDETAVVHSVKEKMDMINTVTPAKLTELLNTVCNIDECLIVYQGKKNLNLSWDQLLQR